MKLFCFASIASKTICNRVICGVSSGPRPESTTGVLALLAACSKLLFLTIIKKALP
jgi:hypothetical protein